MLTNEDGAFSFSDPSDDFTLFIFTKSGFALVRKQDFDSPANLQVRPYARIEGDLLQAPVAGEVPSIKFEIDGEWGGKSYFGPHCHFDIETLADDTAGRGSPAVSLS